MNPMLWLVEARVQYGKPTNRELTDGSKAQVGDAIVNAGLSLEKRDEILNHMNRPDRWEDDAYFWSDNDGATVRAVRLPLPVFSDIIGKIARAAS